MPTSSVVVIVIRIFVLNWILHGIALFSAIILRPLPHQRSLWGILMPFAPSVFLLAVSACLWVIAPWLARITSRGADATVNVSNVTLPELYRFSFVFLGLYFVLSSFADAVNWMHYFATVSSETVGRDPRVENLYQLTRPLLTLAGGLVSLLGAPLWAKKITDYEQKQAQS